LHSENFKLLFENPGIQILLHKA